jgi:hypothetical protein
MCVKGSILDWLNVTHGYTIFKNLVIEAKLDSYLSGYNSTKYTMFIPNDSSLLEHKNELAMENARIFVGSHIIKESFTSESFDRERFVSDDFFGFPSLVDARGNPRYFGKADYHHTWTSVAEIGTTEYNCTNGVVHTISNPIFT